jgi:hypothetical protein
VTKILSKLRGSEGRSVGKVGEVAGAVQKKADLFKDLVKGLFDDKPVEGSRVAESL